MVEDMVVEISAKQFAGNDVVEVLVNTGDGIFHEFESYRKGAVETVRISIKRKYDRQGNVLYLSVGTPRPAVSMLLGDGVLVRKDLNTGEFVGLTVFDFNSKKKKEYTKLIEGSATIPDKILREVIAQL